MSTKRTTETSTTEGTTEKTGQPVEKKKIIDLVTEKKLRMLGDPDEAIENGHLAIAAINGGIQSEAWRLYMEQFIYRDEAGALDPQQLGRLLATDGTLGVFEQDRHRAYMVGNAICTAASPGNGGNFVFGVETIDEGF
jgi:hypothetical protein